MKVLDFIKGPNRRKLLHMITEVDFIFSVMIGSIKDLKGKTIIIVNGIPYLITNFTMTEFVESTKQGPQQNDVADLPRMKEQLLRDIKSKVVADISGLERLTVTEYLFKSSKMPNNSSTILSISESLQSIAKSLDSLQDYNEIIAAEMASNYKIVKYGVDPDDEDSEYEYVMDGDEDER